MDYGYEVSEKILEKAKCIIDISGAGLEEAHCLLTENSLVIEGSTTIRIPADNIQSSRLLWVDLNKAGVLEKFLYSEAGSKFAKNTEELRTLTVEYLDDSQKTATISFHLNQWMAAEFSQSLQKILSKVRQHKVSRTISFEPANVRAVFSYVSLAIVAIASVIFIIFIIDDIDLIQRVIDGGYFTSSEVERSDDRVAIMGWTMTGLMIIAGIATLVWIHRAYKNLPSLNVRGLNSSPGGLVGSFFIPIIFFFRPYQGVVEIWKGSDPGTDIEDSTAWKKSGFPYLVSIWWVLYFTAWTMVIVISVMFAQDEAPLLYTRQQALDHLNMALDNRYWVIARLCVNIVGVVITMRLISSINQRQAAKYEIIKNRGILDK